MGQGLEGLPAVPASENEAHAIQDAVAVRLGEAVGGYKASLPVGGSPRRALIFARTIRASPASLVAAEFPHLAAEAEIAFRFTGDLPRREAPYSREEVAEAVKALPAIEVVSSRFRDPAARHPLENLADGMLNGALILGAEVPAWSGRDLADIRVTLTVNDAVVLQRRGGHPTGDPLGVAVALVEMMRQHGGVAAGQVVATGSWTGMRSLAVGDRYAVEFDDAHRVEATVRGDGADTGAALKAGA